MSLVPVPVAGTPSPVAAPVPNPVAFNFSAGTAISSGQVDTNLYQLWTFIGTVTSALNGATYCPAPAFSTIAVVPARLTATVGAPVPGAGTMLTLDLAHGDYVDVASAQTIAGAKTLSSSLSFNANPLGVVFTRSAGGVGAVLDAQPVGVTGVTADLLRIANTGGGTFFAFDNAGNMGAAGTIRSVAHAVTGVATGLASALQAPSSDIYVARGSSAGAIYLGNAGSRYLYFDGTSYNLPGANLIVNGMTYASSRSWKQDVAPIAFDSVAKIRALNVVSFRYRRDADIGGSAHEGFGDNDPRMHHGIIAEDSPREFLSPDGRGVEAHTTTAIMLDAIKRLTMRIEHLEGAR